MEFYLNKVSNTSGGALGLSVGGEVGIRPGPGHRNIANNAFFNVKLSANIAAKI
ncbi:MAG: hypothetical protein ACXWW0_10185 [Bacteroidia bacterium]